MRATAVSLALALLSGAVLAGEVEFAARPKAARAGGKVKITFEVSAATDVEVAILDAEGKVVRHLAAGLLGKNAPAPLKKGSLAQELLWDGKDDAGKPAKGGPFKVRVRLGLKARLHKIIGWSGQKVGSVRGLVCGPDGTLYLIYGGGLYAHRETALISAFDREGRYLRQVFPGPAGLPIEKRKGWPRIKLEGGEEIPVVYHVLSRCTYPGAVFGRRMFPAATGDGRLVVLSGAAVGTAIAHPDIRGGRRLLILGTDGSVPENYLGPVIGPRTLGGFGHVALSPDDKYAYVAGLFEPGKKGRGLCQVVWRVPLDGSKPAEVFVGKLYAAGKGKTGLDDPQGLATDKDGNLYVADYGNGRVAVFKPDGSFLDEIKAENPDQVRVSRKTGAVYVMCIETRKRPITDGHWYTPAHSWRAKRIVKFGGLKDRGEKAALANPRQGKYGGGARLTLDDSGREPVLWVAGLLAYSRDDIFRIVDRGDKLESVGDPVRALVKKNTALSFIGDVAVVGDKVITRHPAYGSMARESLVYSAETGKPLGTYLPKDGKGKPENVWSLVYGEMVAGSDGRLYVNISKGQLRRYDAAGRPVAFASTGKHWLEGLHHGHTRPAGLFVTAKGDIYVPATNANRKIADDIWVRVIGPDGKVKNQGAVHVQGARLGGIAVDRAGNIYLGAYAVPKDGRIPPPFKGRLPKDGEAHHPSNDYKQYGSIFKFPPTGGQILRDAAGKYVAHCYYKLATVSLKGVLWTRRGGYLPNHGREVGCGCETTRFDIDEYGRLYVPDVFRFRVEVLDGAGNGITHFGSYGNMDNRGPESAVVDPKTGRLRPRRLDDPEDIKSPFARPEIPFGWPLSVDCAAGRVFVADLVNCRVVAVRFEHAAAAECAVR